MLPTRTLSTISSVPAAAAGSSNSRFPRGRTARGTNALVVAIVMLMMALAGFVVRNATSSLSGWTGGSGSGGEGNDDDRDGNVVEIVLQPPPTVETSQPQRHESHQHELELHSSSSSTLTQSSSSSSSPLVICHCTLFSNRSRLLPPPEDVQQVIPRLIAGGMFPGDNRPIIYRNIYGKPSHLPADIPLTSQKGRLLVGLDGCDLRYCQFGGSSEFMRELLRDPNVHTCIRHPTKLRKGWSEDRRVFFPPEGVGVPCNKHNRTVRPLVMRHSMEAWADGYHPGVGAQIETKREHYGVSVSWFLPNVVYHTAEVFGDRFDDILKRQPNFDAAAVRRSKSMFAVMVQSNCGDKTSMSSWNRYTMVREMFSYALHRVSKLPVHNLGRCPLGSDGAERAGITVEERVRLSSTLAQREPTVTLGQKFRIPNRMAYEKFKFAIVFENGASPSYATDRLMNAWMSQTVPIYWGGPPSSYGDVYHQGGYIHCRFPENITAKVADDSFYRKILKSHPVECEPPAGKDTSSGCVQLMRKDMEAWLSPHLDECAREVLRVHEDDAAYEAMLASPAVPYDHVNNKALGVWDRAKFGQMVTDTFVDLGYNEA